MTIMKSVITVPEGMQYTIERFGRYTKTLKPGLSLVVPFIDRIGYRLNMRERKFAVKFSDLKTKDNTEIMSVADIYATVTDAYKVAYGSNDIDENIKLKCEREMKKLVKAMDLSEIMSEADTVDAALLSALKPLEAEWGMQVRYIDVHKIHPV